MSGNKNPYTAGTVHKGKGSFEEGVRHPCVNPAQANQLLEESCKKN